MCHAKPKKIYSYQVEPEFNPSASNENWMQFIFNQKGIHTINNSRYLTLIQNINTTTGKTKYIFSAKDKLQKTIAKFNNIFIDGVAINYKLNKYYPDEVSSTPYYWIRDICKFQVELGD